MSLSITRRKSRRKLQHHAKNLDFELSYSRERKSPDDDSRHEIRSKSRGRDEKSSSSSTSATSYASTSAFSTVPLSRRSRNGFLRRHNSEKDGIRWKVPFEENYLDLDEPISFRIGPVTYEMDKKGNWSSSSKYFSKDLKESIAKLKEKNINMARENNMLTVKNELLADMIARKNLRKDKVQKELERLRKLVSTSSSRFSANSSVNKT